MQEAAAEATGVLVMLGPGEAERRRLRELLDGVFHFEPGLGEVVVINDGLDAEDLGVGPDDFGVPASCRWVHLESPTRDRENKLWGRMCTMVRAMLAWSATEGRSERYVKLDTDALVLGPFADRLAAGFAAQADAGGDGAAGLLGCLSEYDRVVPKHEEIWPAFMRKMSRPVRPWRDGKPRRRRVEFALTGHGATIRRHIRLARRNGYQYGNQVQGGAYAVSRPLIERMHSAGLLDPVDLWDRFNISEDVMLSMYAYAAGLPPANADGPGELFSVRFRGLSAPIDRLVESGNALVHCIKNDPTLNEAEVLAAAKRHRQGVGSGL
ncbi:MAG: hypothetical protein AAF797_16450 [Planctomycetota bacterium]